MSSDLRAITRSYTASTSAALVVQSNSSRAFRFAAPLSRAARSSSSSSRRMASASASLLPSSAVRAGLSVLQMNRRALEGDDRPSRSHVVEQLHRQAGGLDPRVHQHVGSREPVGELPAGKPSSARWRPRSPAPSPAPRKAKIRSSDTMCSRASLHLPRTLPKAASKCSMPWCGARLPAKATIPPSSGPASVRLGHVEQRLPRRRWGSHRSRPPTARPAPAASC